MTFKQRKVTTEKWKEAGEGSKFSKQEKRGYIDLVWPLFTYFYTKTNLAKFYKLSLIFLFFSIFPACEGDNSPKQTAKQIVVSSLLKASNDKTKSLNTQLVLLDSALNLTKGAPIDSLFLQILLAKSNVHYNLDNTDSIQWYDTYLLKSAQKISNNKYAGIASRNLALNFKKMAKLDSAYSYFNSSKNFFQNIKDSSNVGSALLSLGLIQKNKGDYFGAKESLTEAEAYFKNKIDFKLIASTYNELATNNRKLLNYDDAVSYYQKAINSSKSPSDILIYKNNLATAYLDIHEHEKALQILSKISLDSVLKNRDIQRARILDNLTYAKWISGKKIDQNEFLQPLLTRKNKNDKRGQIASYTHLGEYFLKTSSKKAERYLDTVIQISKQLKIPKAEQDALKFLMDLQPNDAKIRNRYILLQDSLYQVGLKVKTQFAKMKYDDEQKQLSILKLEAERERKNTELANQRTQKTLWLSLSGFLVLGGISAFYGLRQRHKKEKLQEVYETEKRISKKVHDELANDIYGVMTRMEHSKTFQKENTLDSLEDIYKRTRDISHETGSIDTQNFQDELKKLLSQFRNDDITIAVKGFSTIKWGGISGEKKIALYRILNELLVNMKKHSAATLVSITFENSKKILEIDYSDNGKGVKKSFQKGAGLSNTENRIKNIDGTFSFESELGKGVRIKCAFPV